ncbi:MAG: hypothetical protein EZS28_021182, partial [Streblomastix strix]
MQQIDPTNANTIIHRALSTANAPQPPPPMKSSSAKVRIDEGSWSVFAHAAAVTQVQFIAEMGGIVSCSLDGSLKAFDILSLKEIGVMVGHRRGIRKYAYSEKYHLIASCGLDHFACVYSSSTREFVGKLIGHMGALTGIAFDEKASTILTISEDSQVGVWDIRSLRKIQVISALDNKPFPPINFTHIVYSPTSCCIIMCSTRVVGWIYKKRESNVSAHEGEIVSVIYNNQFEQLITVDLKGVINVWGVRTGRNLIRFRAEHSGGISSVCLDASGRRLITGGMEGMVKIYNHNRGQLLKEVLPYKPKTTGFGKDIGLRQQQKKKKEYNLSSSRHLYDDVDQVNDDDNIQQNVLSVGYTIEGVSGIINQNLNDDANDNDGNIQNENTKLALLRNQLKKGSHNNNLLQKQANLNFDDEYEWVYFTHSEEEREKAKEKQKQKDKEKEKRKLQKIKEKQLKKNKKKYRIQITKSDGDQISSNSSDDEDEDSEEGEQNKEKRNKTKTNDKSLSKTNTKFNFSSKTKFADNQSESDKQVSSTQSYQEEDNGGLEYADPSEMLAKKLRRKENEKKRRNKKLKLIQMQYNYIGSNVFYGEKGRKNMQFMQQEDIKRKKKKKKLKNLTNVEFRGIDRRRRMRLLVRNYERNQAVDANSLMIDIDGAIIDMNNQDWQKNDKRKKEAIKQAEIDDYITGRAAAVNQLVFCSTQSSPRTIVHCGTRQTLRAIEDKIKGGGIQHGQNVLAACFLPPATVISSADDGSLCAWNIETAMLRSTLKYGARRLMEQAREQYFKNKYADQTNISNDEYEYEEGKTDNEEKESKNEDK